MMCDEVGEVSIDLDKYVNQGQSESNLVVLEDDQRFSIIYTVRYISRQDAS